MTLERALLYITTDAGAAADLLRESREAMLHAHLLMPTSLA